MEEIIIFTVLCIIISSCFVILPTEGKQDNNNYNNNHIIGFSTELIHRDSPLSPLFNPNSSSSEIYQRKDAALRRRYLQQSSNNAHIGRINLVPDGAEYLMKMSYGTPPVESFSMIDTGTSLSWIQCLPCTHCFPSVTPPFNPHHSSTFEFVTECRSKKKYVGNNNSSTPIQQQQKNSPCRYNITYLDQTYSRGEMARETIRVGSRDHTVTFRRFLFGCGHDNGGYFPHGSAGLVGFSPEQDSFIGQLREHHGLKFSHCIAPTTSHSPGKLSFGRDAVISGHGVVSTPLYTGDYNYAVELEYVNIGNTILRYPFSSPNNNKSSSSNRSRSETNGAKILIDTGSEAIHLPESLQMGIDLNVQKLINLRPTSHMPFTLCYPSSSLRDADIPKITFHFQGASVDLGPVNTFVARENKRCLAILPNDEMSLFGNTAMTNFVVAYDINLNRISFKPTDCSHY